MNSISMNCDENGFVVDDFAVEIVVCSSSESLLDKLEYYNFEKYKDIFDEHTSELLCMKKMELYLDSLVRNARDVLKFIPLSLSNFKCIFCGDIWDVPITLKCGHTFSKKCVTNEQKNSNKFICPECGQEYTSDLSHIEKDITVLKCTKRIFTFYWENIDVRELGIYTFVFNVIKNVEVNVNFNYCEEFKKDFSLKKLLILGDLLIKVNKNKEAFYLYLLYWVFVPFSIKAKTTCTNLLHKMIFACSRKTNSTNEIMTRQKTPEKQKTLENGCSHQCHHGSWEINNSEEKLNLSSLIQNFCTEIKQLAEVPIDCTVVFNTKELECSICSNILYDPISTPCGHTYCKGCLNSHMDYKLICPICRGNLKKYFLEYFHFTNKLVELILKRYPIYSIREYYVDGLNRKYFNSKNVEKSYLPILFSNIEFPLGSKIFRVKHPYTKFLIRFCKEINFCMFGVCFKIDFYSYKNTLVKISKIKCSDDGNYIVDFDGLKYFDITSVCVRSFQVHKYHLVTVKLK